MQNGGFTRHTKAVPGVSTDRTPHTRLYLIACVLFAWSFEPRRRATSSHGRVRSASDNTTACGLAGPEAALRINNND
eukprot:6205514-Pleurochrysis_carterae.AAC.1